MDVIWNKKSAALHAVTFYYLGRAENVWSHLSNFEGLSQNHLHHWCWKSPHICQKLFSTCAFFCYSHKKDQLYILFDCRPCAHLFMDKLHRHRWKARYSFAQKLVPCKLRQLCNFCRQLSGPFCHLSPQQPFREGGNYQSTPLLVSTNHQTHELNEVKTPEKLIFLNWKKCKYFKPITQQRHKKFKLFSRQTFTRT